jgi:hypothetical protein
MNPFLEDITPETAEMLHAHATAQGLSVDAYLRCLLGLGSAKNALADMSEEDFDALMEEFAKGTEHLPSLPWSDYCAGNQYRLFAKGTEHLPSLPPDFSRDDIYSDHD